MKYTWLYSFGALPSITIISTDLESVSHNYTETDCVPKKNCCLVLWMPNVSQVLWVVDRKEK